MDKKKIWEEKVKNSKERKYNFDTVSGKKNKLLYYPENLDDNYFNKLGFPGSPAQLHHIKNQTGVGRKSSHFEVIPLCHYHHLGSEEAYHHSPKKFTEKFGSQEDLLKETLELLKQKYG